MENQKEQAIQEVYEEFLNILEDSYGIVRGDPIQPKGVTFKHIAGELECSQAYFNKLIHKHEGVSVAAYEKAILLLRIRNLEKKNAELEKIPNKPNSSKRLIFVSLVALAVLLMTAFYIKKSDEIALLKVRSENSEKTLTDSLTVIRAERDSVQKLLLSYFSKTNSPFIVQNGEKLRDIMRWHGKINVEWLVDKGISINLEAKKAYEKGIKLDTARLMGSAWNSVKTHIDATRDELRALGFFTPAGRNLADLLAKALTDKDLRAGLDSAKDDLLDADLSITLLKAKFEERVLLLQGRAWEKMVEDLNEDISKQKTSPALSNSQEK